MRTPPLGMNEWRKFSGTVEAVVDSSAYHWPCPSAQLVKEIPSWIVFTFSLSLWFFLAFAHVCFFLLDQLVVFTFTTQYIYIYICVRHTSFCRNYAKLHWAQRKTSVSTVCVATMSCNGRKKVHLESRRRNIDLRSMEQNSRWSLQRLVGGAFVLRLTMALSMYVVRRVMRSADGKAFVIFASIECVASLTYPTLVCIEVGRQ